MPGPSLDHSTIATGGDVFSSPDVCREYSSHQYSSWPEHAPIPESFICPLTEHLMKNPVIDREGNSYEKDAILRYLQLVGLSPVTENPLRVSDLVENKGLQRAIQAAMEGKEQGQSKNRPRANRFRIVNSLRSSMKGAMIEVPTMQGSSMAGNSVEGDPKASNMGEKQHARVPSKSRRNRRTARRGNRRHSSSNSKERFRRKISTLAKPRKQSSAIPVPRNNNEVASSGQTIPERTIRDGSPEFEIARSNEPVNLQPQYQKAKRIKERRTMLHEKLKLRQRSASVGVKPSKENKESSSRRNAAGRRNRERRQMRAALNEKLESMTLTTRSMARTKVSTASARHPTVGRSGEGLGRIPVSVVRPWDASFREFSDMTLSSYDEEAQGMFNYNQSWSSDGRREAEPLSPWDGPLPPAPHPPALFDGMPVMNNSRSRKSSISETPVDVAPGILAVGRRASIVSWTDLAVEIELAKLLSWRMMDADAIEMHRRLKVDDRVAAKYDQPYGGGVTHAVPRRKLRRRRMEDAEAPSLNTMYGDDADTLLLLGIFEGSGKTRSDVLAALKDANGDGQSALGSLLGSGPSYRNLLL